MTDRRYSVELARGAEADLEALHGYMAEHRSPQEAAALLDALLAKIETLEAYPERGNVPKELEALGILEYRQTLVPPHRLIYRVVERRVVILVIADGRREMGSLLERRLLAG